MDLNTAKIVWRDRLGTLFLVDITEDNEPEWFALVNNQGVIVSELKVPDALNLVTAIVDLVNDHQWAGLI